MKTSTLLFPAVVLLAMASPVLAECAWKVDKTSLSSLLSDVASLAVHFGDEQTQTWLLVRSSSPEIPAGTITLPEITQS